MASNVVVLMIVIVAIIVAVGIIYLSNKKEKESTEPMDIQRYVGCPKCNKCHEEGMSCGIGKMNWNTGNCIDTPAEGVCHGGCCVTYQQ